MATNQYGQTEWDVDPETAAELRRLSNQEKMAAAMMQRGQVPLTGGMVGNTYVGASPLQGLANMFHQYNASKATQGAEQGYKALSDRKAQEYASAISDYKRNTVGTPEQPMGPPTPEGEMGVKPAFEPTPDQRRQAIIEAAVSTNPRLSKMGQMDFQMDARKEDKQDAIRARMDELQLRIAEGRITKEEADKRAADLRREMQEAGFAQQKSMAQLAAGLKSSGGGVQKAPSGYRYTPDGDLEAIKGGPADVKAQINQQKEVDKAAGVDNQLDAIERNLSKLITPEGKAKEGLLSTVGQLDQYYPEWAMSPETAAANSALKSLQDQMTMVNLSSAKAAVGQSFGSMQVKEWEKFMNGLTNISRGVPDKEMEGNLKFVNDFIKNKRDVLRTAIYAGTYGPKGAASGGQSAAGAIGALKSYASEADAAAAGLKPGTPVIINGVKGTWQ
jgi:hypothetical protein